MELTELPKYWVVLLTEENKQEFIEHVISYLDEIDNNSGSSWLDNLNVLDSNIYYGFDGNGSFNGTNSYLLEEYGYFENNPTILTINEFIYLRNKMKENNNINEMVKEEDIINNPTHYGGKHNVYEAIKVIEAWDLGFRLGNTVKYISRAGKKDKNKTLQDLEKARYYLDREIMLLKGEIK